MIIAASREDNISAAIQTRNITEGSASDFGNYLRAGIAPECSHEGAGFYSRNGMQSRHMPRPGMPCQCLLLNSSRTFVQATTRLRLGLTGSRLALQEHFSSAQLDDEPADDAEALGKAMEELLDDVLERVDTSLDQARALLKAAETPASAMTPAAEATPVLAAQPVAGK